MDFYLFKGTNCINPKKSNTFGREFVCHITLKNNEYTFNFDKKLSLI